MIVASGEVSAALDGLHVRRTAWEYRSRSEVNGLPLVHVSIAGFDQVRPPRVARGLFALGAVAVGVTAFAEVTVGAAAEAAAE